jgi:WD40 repeat protein
MLAFVTPISNSASHIYISAFPFTPAASALSKNASELFLNVLAVSTGRLKFWPAPSSVWFGHSDCVDSVAYSPDGRTVVSGSWDGTIRIWDAQTGAAVGQPLKGHTDYVTSVAYSPDGRTVVSGSDDKTIRIWDAQTGAAVGQSLEGHTGSVYSVAYCSA